MTCITFLCCCNAHFTQGNSNIYLPIITALLSSGLTYLITVFSNRKAELKYLNEQLDNILKTALQYPYLEMEFFTSNWDITKFRSGNKEEGEQYQRYEIYTTLVFNYMARLAKYYNYNSSSIINEVDIKSWIRIHEKIWSNPINENEQRDAYPNEFRKLINSYLKKT